MAAGPWGLGSLQGGLPLGLPDREDIRCLVMRLEV